MQLTTLPRQYLVSEVLVSCLVLSTPSSVRCTHIEGNSLIIRGAVGVTGSGVFPRERINNNESQIDNERFHVHVHGKPHTYMAPTGTCDTAPGGGMTIKKNSAG